MLDRFFRIGSILIALTLLFGCDQETPKELKIAFSEEAHNQVLHLIRDQQFDLDSGIELNLFPTTSPSRSSRLFRNDIVDVAILDMEGALTMAETESITIIGAIGRMQGTRALLVRPEIESIADLRGRKIGVYRGKNNFLNGILDSAGLSDNDVEFVFVPNIENERSLQNGEIDGFVALEPKATRLKRKGLRELYNAAETPVQPIYVLFSRMGYAKDHSEIISALITSWEAGVQYSYDNPQLAAGLLGPKIGVSAQEFQSLIDKYEPNLDLSSGFPYEFARDEKLMVTRLYEGMTPAKGEAPKIDLYWQE